MKVKAQWVAAAGAIIAATAHAGADAPAATAAPPPRPKCDRPESRQFDFWVGRWDVVETQTGAPAGQSVIESLYDGCTLRENWSEPGYTGGSLNTFVVTDGHWHQTWTDSSGTWREFVGGLVNGKMVLTWRHPSVRVPGATAQERMTFTHNSDGTVRQQIDQTVDGGKWVVGDDYIYRRKHGT